MESQSNAPNTGTGSALLSDAVNLELHRADTWNRIREKVGRIARGQDAHAEGEIEGLLRRIDQIERCWIYPGPDRIARLRQVYQSGDIRQLAAQLDAIVDRLTELGDRASLDEEAASVRLGGRLERDQDSPYFTVLLVDPIDPAQL